MVSYQLQSGAEVSKTSFHLWNKNRCAMNRADSDLFTIIFKQMLKDYEMLIGELQMIRIRCRGYASFHLWNENRRAMNRADPDSLQSSLRIIP